MRSLVVFESRYGNTAAVAEAVARGLRAAGGVEVATPQEVSVASLQGADLLVVGTPTHAFGVPSERTWEAPARGRATGPTDGATPPPRVRDWIPTSPRGDSRPAAVFATRLGRARVLTGSAAGGLARRARRQGWTVVDRTDFLVATTEGPLEPGELERAEAWGETLGRTVGSGT